MNTRIAIVGYGNLGRGVEKAVALQDDMDLVGIFTRRAPETLGTATPAYRLEDIDQHEIDVAILCGGSATDLMEQSPQLAAKFNIVDSFDTHAKIPEHFQHVAEAAGHEHLAMISTGWDPGLFSLMRLMGEAVLSQSETTTFWGRGVSQGHSDAIRRIPGVKRAVQYTVPLDMAVQAFEEGRGADLTARDKHERLCYVVADDGADTSAIEEAIVTMPNYFDEYNTTVYFIDEATFVADHQAMPHGGQVLRRGETSPGVVQKIGFSLSLDSNPEFTAAVNVACARAVWRAFQEGKRGCVTIFDLPLAYWSPRNQLDLYKSIL